MSKILVSSIRKFGGAYKGCSIYSFQPRRSKKVSEVTKKFFERNQVEFIDLELNNKYKFYPLANKPLVCAWAEKNVQSEILVFLDSDVIVLNEPIDFLNVIDNEVRLSPVDIKGIGSNGIDDENSQYWNALYKMLNVESRHKIDTLVDRENILAYWNTGHIALRNNNGIFEQWKSNFEKVLSKKLTPANGLFFIEQSTFAATVSSLGLDVKPFKWSYNYPVHLHNRIKNFDSQNNLNHCISWHYHDLFSSGVYPSHLYEFLENSEQGEWLGKMLKENDLKTSYSQKVLKTVNEYKNNLLFKLIH